MPALGMRTSPCSEICWSQNRGWCAHAASRKMIQLTRLNNHALIVNCDLIKFVESAPDTVLTLVSGEKILVRETPAEVLQRIVQFRRDVLEGKRLESGPQSSVEPLVRGSEHG